MDRGHFGRFEGCTFHEDESLLQVHCINKDLGIMNGMILLSTGHALLFGVTQKKRLESHASSWPLRVSNLSMAAGGSLLTLVFGVLNMVVAAAWTCLLDSAGPAKLEVKDWCRNGI